MELIKLNSTGEAVKKVQEFLGIKVDGQFGEKTEAAVKAWQTKNGLKADGIIGDKSWAIMFPSNSIKITEAFIGKHITHSSNRKIKYLVIHYTAGGTSKAGTAKACKNVFLKREASADFVVDDVDIVQINPDPANYFCWAVGDGKGKYGINNKDCISIEICSNLKKGTSASVPNHDGWYFTDAALNNAIELSKYLMQKYNIPIENVIRHYDATHKSCPGLLGWNPGLCYDSSTDKPIAGKKNTEEKWIEFKNKLIQ